MNTDEIWHIDCADLAASLALGERIGTALKGGEIIELISDVGGGKTTLVRGIAEGAGSVDHVSSPTFTLNNIYVGKRTVMHHYDFYRLATAGIMRDELSETVADPKAITIVEWAEVIADVLPADRLTITITVTSDSSRRYTIQARGTATALLERVRA